MRNNTASTGTIFIPVPFGSVIYGVLCTQDLNGDGYPDIVVGFEPSATYPNGGLLIFVHDGQAGPAHADRYPLSLMQGPFEGFDAPKDVACADLFGDSVPGFVSKFDVVAASGSEALHLLEFDSGAFNAEVHCGAVDACLVRIADVTADNTPDEIVANADGSVAIWASVNRPVSQPFGTGCSGSGGLTPTASAPDAFSLGSHTVSLDNARPLSAVVLGISTSTLTTSMGGCEVYLGGPVLTFSLVSNGAGHAEFTYPIPAGFGGAELYFQWVIYDPAGAFMGLMSLSEAIKVKIGS
ncbi:MAG: FG-GAP repeat protein [Salinibacterium sp.]|nr:FG-GAP repeat protein [Salinibacterium sp.]